VTHECLSVCLSVCHIRECECDRQTGGQPDGQTDIIVANDALNYNAQFKCSEQK